MTGGATKTCTKCGRALPLSEYYRRGDGRKRASDFLPGAYQSRCRGCVLAHQREHDRQPHRRSHKTAACRRYEHAHYDEVRARKRAFDQEYRRREAQRRADYRRDHTLAQRIRAEALAGMDSQLDFVVAVAEASHPMAVGGRTRVAFRLPMGVPVPRGVVVLHGTRVGGTWRIGESPTLDPALRRAAGIALRGLETPSHAR